MHTPYRAAAALCLSAVFAIWNANAQAAHSIGGCQILPANNIWNTRVDSLPVDPNSATYVNSIGPSSPLFPDFWSNLSGLFINVVGANQPRVPVSISMSSEADPGPFPIPPNALVQTESDGHLVVVDSGNCKLYEAWQAIPNGDGSWSVGSAAIFDLKSNTSRPPSWTAADAAGMAMLPGLVTYDEVMSGQITHAIGMTVPATQQRFIWPARHWASYVNGSQYPYMGQRFRLKANFDVSPYPFEVQVILNALKKYGAIVEDNGGAWFFSGVRDPRWNNDTLHMLTGVLGSNMEAVDESSLMAAVNSQVAAGSPLALDGIYIDQRQVSAGAPVNAEAILTAPAPVGGVTVSLSASSPDVLGIPSSVTVPAGALSAAIPVTVNSVGLTTPATINGSYQGGSVQSAVLLVNGTTGVPAPRLSALDITPATTAGGTSASATVTLTSPAVAGGTAVSFTSSNGVLTVPFTVTVPAGALSTTVTLPVGSPSATTIVNVTASLYGESLTFPLTITPGNSGTAASSSGTNLAQGKVATQSSTIVGFPYGVPSLAVDGNTDGNYWDGSVTHTNADANAWWQVDLGASANIASLAIWNRSDCCSDRLSDYWVFVSNTPFSSTDTPASLQARPATWSIHQAAAPGRPSTFAVGTQGRYVRIQLTGTNYLSLAEVQVIGTFLTSSSTNLAFGKTATQSSTITGYPYGDARLAIDGNSDGNYFDGSVTHTNSEANAWWQVDLGSTVNIGSVVIWNRTDCCSGRLNNYWVFVSNTPFTATDTPATLQGRAGTWSSQQPNAPSSSTTIPVGSPGRYVRIQLGGTEYLSLAEVQVLGQ